MKLLRAFVSVGIVSVIATSIGLEIKPAQADCNPFGCQAAPQQPQLVDANSPLYGSWRMRYNLAGIDYRSILYMQGYSGFMRTAYFDPRVNRRMIVNQKMRLKSSPKGLVIMGTNFTYDDGTSTNQLPYSTDNFLFTPQPDGSLTAYTCDNSQRCSAVSLQDITRTAE